MLEPSRFEIGTGAPEGGQEDQGSDFPKGWDGFNGSVLVEIPMSSRGIC